MATVLQELLAMIPADTRDRVERAKNRLNEPIRDALRQEMGLRLTRPQSEAGGPAQVGREATPVQIRLASGLPIALRDRRLPEDRVLAALLAPWLRTLTELRSAAHGVLTELIPGLAFLGHAPPVLDGCEDSLRMVLIIAEQLITVAQRANLLGWILEVNEDVLGTYCYQLRKPHHAQLGLPDVPIEIREGRIDLYWSVIGLIARTLGVTTEDLTAVALAHELAHAYSHLGTDIDGIRWPTDSFDSSESPLREGIAQHYARLVCRRIARVAPNCASAYEALLAHQPADYRVHEQWDQALSKEAVRAALIETRRSGLSTVQRFENAARVAQAKLR